MSFESGRKLGLTGSLIEIIMPIIMVAALVFFIWSIFAAISTGNPSIPNLSLISFGFGIILVLIGIITLIGIILFIIGMHRLSQYYNELGIFKNALYGFILSIIGSVTAVAIEFALILTSAGSNPQTSTLSAAASTEPPIAPVTSISTQLVLGFLAVFAIGLVLGIISSIFFMRAFNKLAEKSGNDNFRTAGLLYLLGTVLTIVLIGGLLIWIAWIFAAIGFNSLKPKEPNVR